MVVLRLGDEHSNLTKALVVEDLEALREVMVHLYLSNVVLMRQVLGKRQLRLVNQAVDHCHLQLTL